MHGKTIMEITTFSINDEVKPVSFAKRDAQIESDFTSKQPGFIKRQSGLDDSGNYVVIVYWESLANANASMSKFMEDKAVADYAQMIKASTMKMARYTMDKPFDAEDSRFVEVMAFDVNEGTNMPEFNALNKKVENDFTGKRKGFLQRLIGTSETGKQVVAVYWASKSSSDASLQPFMDAAISKEFMQQMNQASVSMGRYTLLNMELRKKK